MKILQVIPYFVPAWDYGGPLQVCYAFSKQLVANGHEVTVFTTDTLNIKSRIKKRDGIKIRRFKNLCNYLTYRQHLYFPPGMFLAAQKDLKSFDIIHMHEYRNF